MGWARAERAIKRLHLAVLEPNRATRSTRIRRRAEIRSHSTVRHLLSGTQRFSLEDRGHVCGDNDVKLVHTADVNILACALSEPGPAKGELGLGCNVNGPFHSLAFFVTEGSVARMRVCVCVCVRERESLCVC